MATLTLNRKVLTARGTIVYDPKRFIESNSKGKQVVGHKRTDNPWWLVVNCSDTISAYYRWWIENEILNPLKLDNGIKLGHPMWGSHITVLDGRQDVPVDNREFWKKHNGEVIEFEYIPMVYQTWKFWSIPVRCKKLDMIREELGFDAVNKREASPVTGFNYHITIGRLP